MAIAPTGGSSNDFSESLGFYSLLLFDGSFEDSGTRSRTVQPEAFGSPTLDTYAGGFGYRFGNSSGVRLPGLMPPASSGKLAAFSTILRLDPSGSEGSLVRFVSDDGSYAIVLGVKDLNPYVETQINGKNSRATAASSLPASAVTLQASLWPKGEELAIAWRADGQLLSSPSLSLPSAPPSGNAILGGKNSMPGVYDGFGLVVGGSVPTYRYAARRAWKGSLILAESFEDNRLPGQATAVGGVRAVDGALALDASSGLTLSQAFSIGSGLFIEADIGGDIPSFTLGFSDANGKRLFAILGSGDVVNSSGKRLGAINIDKGKLSVSLKAGEGSALLSSSSEKATIGLPSIDGTMKLSLERGDASHEGDSLYVSRVLARSSLTSKP
jgi:hypothetical protein